MSAIKFKQVLRATGVREGEDRLVIVFMLFAFLVGMSAVFTQVAAYALFLSSYTSDSLPYVYIGVAVAVTIATPIYLRLKARGSLPRFLRFAIVFLIASLAVLWLALLLGENRILYMALPIWHEVVAALHGLIFWELAGRLFDVRQGKRLFGTIRSVEFFAGIVGGFSASALVALIGTRNLMGLSVAANVGLLLVCGYILRRWADRFGSDEKNKEKEKEEAAAAAAVTIRQLLRQRFVVLILAMVGVSIVQVYILDNVFYEVASKKFPTEESFASFFGTFSAVASLLTWFALALATGPIMTRFGLKTSLQVAPIAILIGAAGATLAHVFRAPEFAVFWMIIGCKLADEVLNPAFNEASVSVLYQVLPAPQRARVRSLADGFTSPVCAGIAGALLLLMTGPMEMDYTKLLFALAIVVLLCVLVAWHLPVEYRASLSRGLANRQLQSIGDMLAESRGAEVIREGLQAKSASRVIYCLELLTEMGDESLRPALVSLLDHPDARVRSEALRRIERLESLDALGRVQSAADSDPESSVRGQALRTIAHFTGGEQLDLITPYLASPDRDIRKGALIGLIRSGGIAGILEAGHKLMGLVESEREDERALAAEVVGEIGIANFYQPLISLLADDSPRVRLTALIAASHLKSPQLAKPVLDCLSAPGMSASAVGALIAIGAPGLDRVAAQARAAQTSRDSLSFSRLAYVLGRVHSSRCVPLLLELAGESRARSRRALVEALTRHEYSAAGDNVVFPRLWVADEAEMITWNLTAANDLKHTPACELLVRGLYQDVDRRRESLIYLLALLYPAKLILRTRVHLHHRSADKRAMAVEMLDNVLDAGDKRLLLPLIDTDDRKVQQQRLAESGWMPQPPMTLTDRLRDVISTSRTDDEHWLRCAALHAIGKLRLEDLRAEVVELLATPGPIGIEATWALILMDAPDERTAKRHLKSMEGRQFLLTPVERVIFLKGVPIFAQLPDSDLLELSDRLREKEATPDTPILVKGEWGSSLYVLVTGEVRVHDGDREIARLGEGALFNELAALDPEPHAVSVTTTKDSLLFSLDSESLHELMNEHPQVGRGIMRVLCQRLREAVTAKNAPEPEHRLDPAARAGEAVASRV